MIRFDLSREELARVKRAAAYAGFPWQPICTRPKTARRFARRVEAEMRRRGALSQGRPASAPLRVLYGQ